MKLVKFEFLKYITNKLFILSFFILLLLNFVMLNYQSYSNFKIGLSYSSYKKLNVDLKGMSHKEKGEYINNLYERANAINTIYNIQNLSKNEEMKGYAETLRKENLELYNKYYKEANSNPKFKYTNDSMNELKILTFLKEDYAKVENYENLINDIITEANNLQSVSIFNNKDSISLKKIINTSNAYKEMLGIKPNYQLSVGIDKLTKVSFTEFFVVILIFIIATILITEEKEKNLFTIIKSTKNGHTKTIFSKILSLFIGVMIVSLLFYGMNFLYYLASIGYGDVFAPIQSISTFVFSTFKIDILEYLFIFFTSKIFVFFFFAIIMFFLSIKSNNGAEQIVKLTVLSLISFYLYRNVSVNSNINVLKYANFIGFLDINSIYNTFENLQFFNLMFHKVNFLMTLKYSSIVILIFSSIFYYLKKMSIQIKENKVLQSIKNIKIFSNIRFNSVLKFEIYKLLILNKAIIIILLFTLFIGYNLEHQNFSLSFSESFYKNYMEILKGDLTEEKEAIIKNSKKDYEYAEEQLNNINLLVQEGKISKIEGELSMMPYQDIMRTYPVFQKVYAIYEYVKDNNRASFVYDTGYNKLFRLNNDINENDIYLIVVTIIALLNLYIMEYKTGFISILNTTKKGGRITSKNKVLASIIVCSLIYIISIVPEIAQTFKTYGLESLHFNIASIQMLKHLSFNITILEYMILFYFVRYLSYILVILIINFLGLKIRNMIFVFITSISILLAPFLLHIIGMDILGNVQVYPFMNLSSMLNVFWGIIFICIIVIFEVILYNDLIKRLE